MAALAAAFLAVPATASADTAWPGEVPHVDYAGVQHLHYKFPVTIYPGQNSNLYAPTVQKPQVPGYITRFKPNLVYTNGKTPPVDVLHLHHGVWVMRNYPTFAGGEEKTITQFPKGFGYRYDPSDPWIVNYMLHNLLPNKARVYLTWDIDFVPEAAAQADGIKEVKPLWLDVAGIKAYPVFDVHRGWGAKGRYTFPAQARGAERAKIGAAHQFTAPSDMTLVAAGGHLHPGGLYLDLDATRGDQTRRVFRSEAKYYEPAGAVSWDVSLTFTKPDWRVALKKGDGLDIEATYDSKRASWYESMGIIDPLWYTEDPSVTGADPFTTDVDWHGIVTHGHLAENDHHGGTGQPILPDARRLLSAGQLRTLDIKDFIYGAGDLTIGRPPTVKQGQSLTFTNLDSPEGGSEVTAIYHTITGCKAPCNKVAGVAYPLADGATFDSGELGYGSGFSSAAANRSSWSTPKSLSPGTYTYFCRIHPFMRGSFRVVPR